jgi:Cu/Ag efflux protein CusF
MKFFGLISCAAMSFALLGAASPLADSLSTDRHVHGVITSVEPAVVTIASSQRTVSGKIDPARTKVTLHGKPAKLGDLKVTDHAKAELCLDDVWVSIDAH